MFPKLSPGLALDIDETLSRTIYYRVEQMQQKFWNPEQLSVEAMVEKYRYSQNVPYRQTQEALDRVAKEIQSNELQTKLPVIPGAQEIVAKINEIIPITAYITIRPETVISGTETWLQKYHFPDAPIIARPLSIPKSEGNQRKAQLLQELYPTIQGIVDDNAEIVKFLPESYKGKVFLYSHKALPPETKAPNAKACFSREDVYATIK